MREVLPHSGEKILSSKSAMLHLSVFLVGYIILVILILY